MGTWSISPKNLASITSNGLVTFSEHSSDTNYTITYKDDECGTITKKVTVYACETPDTGTCDASTSGIGTCVSNKSSSSSVQIGTWTKNQYCSGSWSYDSSRSISGTNFINTSSIEFRSDGKIYAKVKSTNPSSSQRSCKIPTKLGSTKTDYLTVTQCGTTTGTCSCSVLQVSGLINFDKDGNYNGSFSYTPTACTPTVTDYPSWINSITMSGGRCIASAEANGSGMARVGHANLNVGSENCGRIAMTQDVSYCDTCGDIGINNVIINSQDAGGAVRAVLAIFNTECDGDGNMYAQKLSGDMNVTNLGIVHASTNLYTLTGSVASNTSSSLKTANIGIYATSSENSCKTLTVTQNVSTFTVSVTVRNNKASTIYVDQIKFMVGTKTVIASDGNTHSVSPNGSTTITYILTADNDGKSFSTFNVVDTTHALTEYVTSNTGGTLTSGMTCSGTVS